MDRWLKVLIAAACVTVIAGGAYYAWSEYRRYEARREAEEIAMFTECAGMLRDIKSGDTSKDWRIAHVVTCLKGGYLFAFNFDTPALKKIFEQAREVMRPK